MSEIAREYCAAQSVSSCMEALWLGSNKIALPEDASEDLGGKLTWHYLTSQQSLVANATVVTVRNANCGTTCRGLIVGLSQSKVLSSMAVHNQIALKMHQARQRKNGPNFLYS